MRRILVAVCCALACALALAACSGGRGGGGQSSSPSPTAPATTRPTTDVTYQSGTAQVTVSGATSASFTAGLETSQDATFTKDDGFDVWYRAGDQALNVSGDVSDGEADVFVRVETGAGDGNAYIDPFHNICDVTVTTYTDTELAGSFTCTGLPSFNGKSKADAQGTFSATA